MYLEKISSEYVDIVFNWANDEEARQFAFNPEKIEYSTHIKWFESKLHDSNCLYFIAKENNENIGQIRIDVSNNKGIISYFIDKKFRKKGYGCQLISMLETVVKESAEYKKIRLIGRVKKDNIGSIKCFEKNEYRKIIKGDYIEFEKKL